MRCFIIAMPKKKKLKNEISLKRTHRRALEHTVADGMDLKNVKNRIEKGEENKQTSDF